MKNRDLVNERRLLNAETKLKRALEADDRRDPISGFGVEAITTYIKDIGENNPEPIKGAAEAVLARNREVST